MTVLWIGLAALAVLIAALAASLSLRGRIGGGKRARASIERLADDTSIDRDTGAVRSVQRADVLIEREALEEIWTPVQLERLARTYWRFLTRVTLGLIRVIYNERGRSVVLLAKPFRLLSFEPPEYEMDDTQGLVRWRIERGLLVARRGRDGAGYLQIEVTRRPGDTAARQTMHVEVAVVNFYPAIASRLSLRLYNATQSRIHVIVTYGFLRSLVRLDLAESRIGRFAGSAPVAPRPARDSGSEPAATRSERDAGSDPAAPRPDHHPGSDPSAPRPDHHPSSDPSAPRPARDPGSDPGAPRPDHHPSSDPAPRRPERD